LLIDKDQRSSYIISLILKLNGYNVEYYADAKSVLSRLRSRTYDLILLSLTSIETNYIELYHQIRHKDAEVKICFMTDNRWHDKIKDEQKFEQLSKGDRINPCVFVEKPVNANEILDIVASHLDQQHQ